MISIVHAKLLDVRIAAPTRSARISAGNGKRFTLSGGRIARQRARIAGFATDEIAKAKTAEALVTRGARPQGILAGGAVGDRRAAANPRKAGVVGGARVRVVAHGAVGFGRTNATPLGIAGADHARIAGIAGNGRARVLRMHTRPTQANQQRDPKPIHSPSPPHANLHSYEHPLLLPLEVALRTPRG